MNFWDSVVLKFKESSMDSSKDIEYLIFVHFCIYIFVSDKHDFQERLSGKYKKYLPEITMKLQKIVLNC